MEEFLTALVIKDLAAKTGSCDKKNALLPGKSKILL